MKRLIVLNRYFFPDYSASSQILSDLAFHLAAAGADVHVITSRQLYDDPDRQLPAHEVANGVSIHRVSTTKFGRKGLAGRGLDYFSFYASARRLLNDFLEPSDILIAMTDPPLVSIIAMRAAKRRRAHLVNWLQDIYPEVAVQLGVPFLKGPIAAALSLLRDHSLKSAALNVVVGQLMVERLAARGVAHNRIRVIPNWADDDEVVPVAHRDNRLRRDWGLENKFVVGYSGNLGRAHEFDTVLAASELLRHDPRFVFLFIGSGHRMDQLSAMVKARGLQSSFRSMPYQDRALLKLSLAVADVHWVSLKPSLEGLIVPSKFYGIAAAGRPIIAVTAKTGEFAQLIEQHQCGLVIEPGDANGLAEALLMLSADARLTAEMGARARTMLDASFSRRQAFERWRDALGIVDIRTHR